MIHAEIYKDVVSSFGEMWKFKERDKTLEVITPFITTTQKFVSVFLTERDGEYIVSDGGWICEGLYENTFERGIDCFERVLSYYIDTYNIKEAKRGSDITIFYKKTDSKISVPSMLLDMANFVSVIISLTNVEYADKEKEIEQGFNQSARNYLQNIRRKKDWGDWHFNEYLGNQKVRINAILRKKDNKLVLLNFITGSHYQYFRSNISKTNLIFELASKTTEASYIESKIALIDNKARGYAPEHVSIWLEHLLSNTNSKKIEWTRKKELENL